MKKVNFHAPGDNVKSDGYVVTNNTQKLIKEHLKLTDGKVQLFRLSVSLSKLLINRLEHDFHQNQMVFYTLGMLRQLI